MTAFKKIGATVEYDTRLPWTGGMEDPPKWPQWLLNTVGVDFFARVKRLYLNNTQVTDAGVARLKQTLPKCTIDRRLLGPSP